MADVPRISYSVGAICLRWHDRGNRLERRGIPLLPPMTSQDSRLLTKRKLSAVIATLDEAVKRPTPPSKTRVQRTSTVALEALRPASSSVQVQPAPSSYVPASLPLLVQRIASFRLATYSAPATLSPLLLACHGWQNDGKNRVQCVTCDAGLVLLPPSSSWKSPAGEKLLQEYTRQIEAGGHLRGCPWRVGATRKSIYRVGAAKGEQKSKVLTELVERCKVVQAGRGGDALACKPVLDEAKMSGLRKVYDLWATSQPASVPEQPTTSPATSDLTLALLGWSISTSLSSSISSSDSPSARNPNATLSCHLCARHILLAPFCTPSASTDPTDAAKPSKIFDPISQHQPFCPYIDPFAGSLLEASGAPSPVREETRAAAVGWEKILQVLLGQPRESWSGLGAPSTGTKLPGVRATSPTTTNDLTFVVDRRRN